jgi:hypothetical protein
MAPPIASQNWVIPLSLQNSALVQLNGKGNGPVSFAWPSAPGGWRFQCNTSLFGRPNEMHIEMWVIDLSFSLKTSIRSSRSVLCALFLCFQFLSLGFIIYFRFCRPASKKRKYNIFGYGKDIS